MGVWERILLGLFVGILYGIIPLVYCIIKHMKIMSAVGMSVTVASGVLFSALEKSPFSAIVVAALFILVVIVKNKHDEKNDEEQDEDKS